MDLALQSAFLAEASTLLILLAGAILLFRSFREHYLVPWIAGWTAFTACKAFLALSHSYQPSSFWTGLALCSFAAAVWCFSAAVFSYVYQNQLRWPAAMVLALGLALGLAQTFWFRHTPGLMTTFYICWRLVLAVAAAALVRFAWGRRNIGRWLLAVMLLMLHLDMGGNVHRIIGHDLLVDVLLGISIMVIVLDDSRVQIKRLDVLNRITHQISDSHEFDLIVQKVLEELVGVTHAKGAWFRVLEGEKLILKAHVGITQEFADRVRQVDSSNSITGAALRDGEVQVLRSHESGAEVRQALDEQGFDHVVLIPVEGKTAHVGMLVLGVSQFRTHTENERRFLKATAKQLGLAAENRKLVDEVVQSRNEWAST